MNKKYYQFNSTQLFCFFLFFTVLLCGVAGQYYIFKRSAQELLELKEEYRIYTLELKTKLNNLTQKENEKKKEVTFNVVNRDDNYIFDACFSFAKQHQVESLVADLLDLVAWEQKVKPAYTFAKKVKKFVSVKKHSPQMLSNTFCQKDFLFKWPIEKSKFWLSSFFGPRKNSKTNKIQYHYGIDMAACKGTPVRPAAAGIVLESGWHKGYGNYILIAHNKKYKTRYAHLEKKSVKIGQKVHCKNIIGTVGDTGLVRKSGKDASHLHFEVYAFQRHINPLSVLV